MGQGSALSHYSERFKKKNCIQISVFEQLKTEYMYKSHPNIFLIYVTADLRYFFVIYERSQVACSCAIK